MTRKPLSNLQAIEALVQMFEKAETSTQVLRRTLANHMIDWLRMSRLIDGTMKGEEAAEFIERVHLNAANVWKMLSDTVKGVMDDKFQLIPIQDFLDKKYE
jgi:hypothetical protein